MIKGCELYSADAGGPVKAAVVINGARDPVIADCLIVSDATGSVQTQPRGVFLDHPDGVVGRGYITGCHIIVSGDADVTVAVGVQVDRIGGTLILSDCLIDVEVLPGTVERAEAVGIEYKCTSGCGDLLVFGGAIRTTSGRERETRVYDVIRDQGDQERVYISGTRLSKWHGPIKSAERRRSTVQRVLNVSPTDNDGVLQATTLTTAEQEIVTGIESPDVYRVVTITGSLAGMTQDVYVIGADYAESRIAERLTLGGTSTITGDKPFMTITKVSLPARNTQLIGSQTVAVGTGKKLGLCFPIGDSTDIIQIGRMSSQSNQYMVEDLSGFFVDEIYATGAPDSITIGDSCEVLALSSQ